MVDEELKRRALEIWQRAYECQMRGEMDEAVRAYQESLAVGADSESVRSQIFSLAGQLAATLGQLEHLLDENTFAELKLRYA